jgi:hypothetical protein
VERTNGEGALNARSYGQKLYSLGADGELVGRVANSDGGEWLPDDALPETLMPLLGVFFEEMWPVLVSSAQILTDYIASDEHAPGDELPGKTFTATPGFGALQTGDGALTHAFEIAGAKGRRMVIPYQVWMLERLAEALRLASSSEGGRDALAALLGRFERGAELLELDALLEGCLLQKNGALLFSKV